MLAELLREVIEDDRQYHAFRLIESIRAYWRGQEGTVNLTNLGAPSKTGNQQRRSIARLVRQQAIGSACGRLLFRLALWLQPQRIIELGTNAGISTIYLHAANTETPLDTVEGNPEIATLAQRTFAQAGTSARLHSHLDTFKEWLDTLPPPQNFWAGRPADQQTGRLLFLLDGDHRYQPTLDYVQRLLPYADDESIFVIADIHWSEEMEKAWAKLKSLPRVTASVDTYHFGLLFFRPGLNGPHVELIPTKFKPWRLGFFA